MGTMNDGTVPPKRTSFARVSSYAIAAPVRACGADAGATNVQRVPFHTQVSP
jgi:hypothetical protein